MEFTLNVEDIVENYGGTIDNSGFEKAGFEAAVNVLGEKAPGWEHYHINQTEHQDDQITHETELLDRNFAVVHNVTIEISPDNEMVNVTVESAAKEPQ